MSARRPGAAPSAARRCATACSRRCASAAGAALAAARASCVGGGCDLRRHRPAITCGCRRPLRALHEAWRIAAHASASSPGHAIAYYELQFDGLRLPGERPWAGRWRSLRHATRYEPPRARPAVIWPAVHLRVEGGRRRRRARSTGTRRSSKQPSAWPAFGVQLSFAGSTSIAIPTGKISSGVRAGRRGRAERPALGAGQDALLAFLGRFDEVIRKATTAAGPSATACARSGSPRSSWSIPASAVGHFCARKRRGLPLQVLPSTASR